MQINVYLNSRDLKFDFLKRRSKPFAITLSTEETKDSYSELPVTDMTMEERLELLQKMAIETLKKGLLAGGAGKYIDVEKNVVIQNNEIVIKEIPEADVRPDVHINGRGLNPFQLGKFIAENKIRGLDSDPSMRGKVYENVEWDQSAVERIRKWVIEVKLPNNPVEWQYVNRLQDDDRDREINKIVNAIIYNQNTGIFVKNKMRKNESDANKKYKQTINDSRRMNFK